MVDVNESIKKAEKQFGRELTEKEKQAVNALGQLFNLFAPQGMEEKTDGQSKE